MQLLLPRAVWLLLALVGAILPLMQFLPWVSTDPARFLLFWDQATTTAAAKTVMADVLWAALVFSALVIIQGIRTRAWHLLLAVLATWTIGLSCGLPLFFGLLARK